LSAVLQLKGELESKDFLCQVWSYCQSTEESPSAVWGTEVNVSIEVVLEDGLEGMREVLKAVYCVWGELPDVDKAMSDQMPQILVY
jgi:hypothetical protein